MTKEIIPADTIQQKILLIRGQKPRSLPDRFYGSAEH
jgi:hypothetical protein